MAFKIRIRNGDGTFKADESDFQHLDSDFLSSAGVADLSTDFLVTQDTGSNRNVAVTRGINYQRNPSFSRAAGLAKYLTGELEDASITVAVSPNSTLATRVDYICIKYDSSVTPNVDGSNTVFSVVDVVGTSNGVAPAIPSGYQVLARLDLLLEFTGITNAMITDMRMQASIDPKDSWAGIDKSEDPDGVSSGLAIVQYVSASSIKIYGDWRNKIGKGTKIKYYQGGSIKYHYIVSSGSFSSNYTTYNIAVNTDYVMANSAISRVYFSNGNPVDFPDWFNYTPTIAGNGSMTVTGATVGMARFRIQGRMVTTNLRVTTMTIGGTPNTIIIVSAPVDPIQNAYGSGLSKDSGYLLQPFELDNVSNNMNFYATASLGTAWTSGSGREIYGTISYEY